MSSAPQPQVRTSGIRIKIVLNCLEGFGIGRQTADFNGAFTNPHGNQYAQGSLEIVLEVTMLRTKASSRWRGSPLGTCDNDCLAIVYRGALRC